MQQRVGQTKPPASVKNANNFFPLKPFSPNKHDVSFQYYSSENPTPNNQNSKKAPNTQVPPSNMISINNGLHNQIYYMQPLNGRQISQDLSNVNSGSETLDQYWSRPSQQRRFSKPQNLSLNANTSNKQLIQEDQRKRSKAQNLLFQMLMNDAMARASGQKTDVQQRKSSKSKFITSNVTTPHSLYVGDKQRRVNNSLQKRLEETHQLTTKSKPLNNTFNTQTANWYLPNKREQSSINIPSKPHSINFNQTVPHQRPSEKNYYINQSLEGQNTGEVSFENNILQRGFQGDQSGYFQINSDTSKNLIDEAHYNGYGVKQQGKHHDRAVVFLEEGKGYLSDKRLEEAIVSLKQSISIDPTLLEGHYYLGIGQLGNMQYTKAISAFQSIISQDSTHRKNVYLLLAIAYKKINELDQAINCVHQLLMIDSSLNLYNCFHVTMMPQFIEKQLDKALIDFHQAIQNSPQKGLGYLGKADCLRYAGNFEEAVRTYQKAIQCDAGVSQAAYLKKAMTLFESRQYDESVKDLNKILSGDPFNSEAYYFKGLCRLKMQNSQEALLCFEQSIKHNNSKKAVTKSLYEIAKIKIEQRDFYAAYHTLNRADFLDTEKTYLEKFRLFTEAVIFLMKRKFSESIVNFQLIQQNHSLNDFLKPLFYAYRSYGHFCLSNHQKALDDYKNLAESVGEDELGAQYNKLLCDGIIRVQQTHHEKGIDCFERAGKLYPKKMEPRFYKGVTCINKAFHCATIIKDSQKLQLIQQGLQLINEAQILNEQNANLFYIRAIIKAFLQKYGDAISDVDKAIEKSEDNVPKYFYFRALVYACSKQYKSAVNDFSICINLDENYADAYLQRAKSNFLYGDSTQAFADLQIYISLKPDNPDIHIWAGNFLFCNSAVEDAIKAYSQAPDFSRNQQILYLRAQCYLVTGQLQDCLGDVKQILEITKDKQYEFDRDCIKSILIVFRDSEEEQYGEENDQERQDLQRRLQQTQQLLTVMTLNKQLLNGRLFKLHHLYIFRGVCLFHLRKYEDSLKDFSMARTQKEIQINEKRISRSNSDGQQSVSKLFEEETNKISQSIGEISEEEEDSDLLEILEIRFNELACLVILKQFRKAKDRCKQLIENINESKQDGLQYLLLTLEKQILKSEGKDCQIESDYDRVICLYDEFKENPLCFQVPIVNIAYINIKLRLSFSYPKVIPPSLVPILDKKFITEISPLSVENKPEAPWIRRNEKQGDMIMFTDNIQMMEDIRLETEDNEKEEGKHTINYLNKATDQSQNITENSLPVDRNTMKKNLMLDLEVEEKLQKILEKRRKQ